MVYVEPAVVSDEPLVRSAVLLDPSGIKIRLLEGDVYQLNKARARGRLAYVSLPVKEYKQIEQSIQFYGA